MKFRSKPVIIILLLAIAVGLIYSLTEVLYPRDYPAKISLEGISGSQRLVKGRKDNHYYISFTEYNSNGKPDVIKVECTKDQYNFIESGKIYHMIYVKNYFNRKTGKIKVLDDKPIYNGKWPAA